jgi:uncharacterized SAM-binding protein YcdF (DUF218 family)
MTDATRHSNAGLRPAIIIFGAAVRAGGTPSGALRRRVEAAAAFGRLLAAQGHAPLYVPTGGVGRHGPAEAVVAADLLAEFGVPEHDIQREETGTDTVSSVRAVRRLLRGRVGRVYAASSGYHLPRCVLLLRLAGLRALPAPRPTSPAASGFCLRWYWRLRELPALPFDAAVLLTLRVLGRL